MITVQDSGEGVDPDLVERFFEPFFTTRSDGTGLGLAIVRRLIEGHADPSYCLSKTATSCVVPPLAVFSAVERVSTLPFPETVRVV